MTEDDDPDRETAMGQIAAVIAALDALWDAYRLGVMTDQGEEKLEQVSKYLRLADDLDHGKPLSVEVGPWSLTSLLRADTDERR